VVRVGRSPLPLHLALQPADRPRIGRVSSSQKTDRLASPSRATRAREDGPRSAPMMSVPTVCLGL
jgi:hypothetical protein